MQVDPKHLPPPARIPAERGSMWREFIVPLFGISAMFVGLLAVAAALRTPPPASLLLPSQATPVMAPQAIAMPTLIYVQEVPTATREPTPSPTVNPVVAAWTPTPTVVICPSDLARVPDGVTCEWPPAAPLTSTPIPPCITPLPGDTCDPHATVFSATPIAGGRS